MKEVQVMSNRERGEVCLYCKWNGTTERDSRGRLHTICMEADSENFLREIDFFDGCKKFELESER